MREYLLAGDREELFYRTRVRGGRWTYDNLGQVADVGEALARGGIATEWAALYDFPRSRGFAFGAYGRANAMRLAKEIARKGNYFIGLYLASDDEDFVYTQADIDNYPEDAEFLDWMLLLDVEHPAYGKGLEIRDMWPRVG